MIGSIHLADIGARRALPLLGHPIAAASVPGLRYAARVAAAPLATPPLPQAGRAGLIALWDDDRALDGFLAGHPLAAALADGWHVRLEPVNAHDYHRARGSGSAGSWPGLDGELTGAAVCEGPAVVLTLARTRVSQLARFLWASWHAARPLAAAPGLLWASALARPPLVATCSLWASATDLEAYAYQVGGGHSRAMAADRARAVHRAGVFFRFRPYRSVGHLAGRNPLAADWMARGQIAPERSSRSSGRIRN